MVYAGATTMGYSARLRFWAQEQLPAYLDRWVVYLLSCGAGIVLAGLSLVVGSSKVTPVDSEVVIEMTKQSCTLPPRLAQKKHY